VVDVYYMYRLTTTRTPQSSQGTSEAWHLKVDYELLLYFCHEKWGGPSHPSSDIPVASSCKNYFCC